MIYIFTFIGILTLYYLTIQCITVQSNKVIFSFFFKAVFVLTTYISIIAIITTYSKTIMLLWLTFMIYAISTKYITFSKPNFQLLKKQIKFGLIVLPIIIFQWCLNFNFSDFTFFVPPDDVLFYATISKNLLDFSNENYSGVLQEIYPHLFNGMSPYHYYELWLNSSIAHVFNLSHAYTLLFITYPILLSTLCVGILSLFEIWGSIRWYHYLITFALLFIGPLYFNIYETVLKDGNFLNSTVFTITGFVKQTLPFSFYGQKHIPVYMFSILIFSFLHQKQYLFFYFISTATIITSFGILPGVYGALGICFFWYKDFRNIKIFIILAAHTIVILLLYSIFSQGINSEVSQKTFYFSDFLQYLNFKGEILRIVSKFIVPFLWFSILYIPIIVLFILLKKTLLKNSTIKRIGFISANMFVFGAFFICIVQGLNSDQFLTNLLPIFNVAFIFGIVYLISTVKNNYYIYVIVGILFIYNLVYIVQFHIAHRVEKNAVYSNEYINSISNVLRKYNSNVKIGYILSDSIIEQNPPINWYPYRPGRFFIADNYTNFININYPYTKYPRNSSSISFAPWNQMRFYLHDSILTKLDFEQKQFEFIKKYEIKIVFTHSNVTLSKEITQSIQKEYIDYKSKEKCLILK